MSSDHPIKKAKYFSLAEHVGWAIGRFGEDKPGVRHLVNTMRGLSPEMTAHHFSLEQINAPQIRAQIFRTSSWRHDVSKYPELEGLRSTMINCYPSYSDDTAVEITHKSVLAEHQPIITLDTHPCWGQF